MAFRMERVTRLRTQLRELRRAELETLHARVADIDRASTEALERGDASLAEEARRAAATPLEEAEFKTGRDFIRGLGDRRDDLAREKRELLARIEEKRGEVVEARREERKLLRLQENDRARAKHAEVLRELAELDEFALRTTAEEGEGNDGSKQG